MSYPKIVNETSTTLSLYAQRPGEKASEIYAAFKPALSWTMDESYPTGSSFWVVRRYAWPFSQKSEVVYPAMGTCTRVTSTGIVTGEKCGAAPTDPAPFHPERYTIYNRTDTEMVVDIAAPGETPLKVTIQPVFPYISTAPPVVGTTVTANGVYGGQATASNTVTLTTTDGAYVCINASGITTTGPCNPLDPQPFTGFPGAASTPTSVWHYAVLALIVLVALYLARM